MNIYKGKAEVFQKYGDWKNLFLYQLRFWKNSNFVEFIIIKKGGHYTFNSMEIIVLLSPEK